MLRAYLIASLALGASATIGFCNDKDVSCGSWARDGECEGDNNEHVKNICPHSCGVCSIICSDRHESCADWAKQGECKSAPDYMMKECSTSCGLCSPKCIDLSPDCNHWFKEGECASNAHFMNMQCPVSCGVCKPACKDTHDDCPGWAKEGECVNNPGHTLKACPSSCDMAVCKSPGGCVDHVREPRPLCARHFARAWPATHDVPRPAAAPKDHSQSIRMTAHAHCFLRPMQNATACAVWALDDECLKNPGMMHAECPDTCGVCSVVCQDKDESCQVCILDGRNTELTCTACTCFPRLPCLPRVSLFLPRGSFKGGTSLYSYPLRALAQGAAARTRSGSLA